MGGLWKGLRRLLAGPSFRDHLEDAAEALKRKPVEMRCPACGKVVPLLDRCPNCGTPRHPPLDERV
ncbi:MAG: hypothetical protein AABZ64_17685 [Nitrospinota bacterium]